MFGAFNAELAAGYGMSPQAIDFQTRMGDVAENSLSETHRCELALNWYITITREKGSQGLETFHVTRKSISLKAGSEVVYYQSGFGNEADKAGTVELRGTVAYDVTMDYYYLQDVSLHLPGAIPYDPFRTLNRVRLCGLSSETHNGREGYIVRREVDSGRYRIMMDPSENSKAGVLGVKAQNIILVENEKLLQEMRVVAAGIEKQVLICLGDAATAFMDGVFSFLQVRTDYLPATVAQYKRERQDITCHFLPPSMAKAYTVVQHSAMDKMMSHPECGDAGANRYGPRRAADTMPYHSMF